MIRHLLFVAAIAAAPLKSQIDYMVGPGGYDLPTAAQLAFPGDRIVVTGDLGPFLGGGPDGISVEIRGGVSLESPPGSRHTIYLTGKRSSGPGDRISFRSPNGRSVSIRRLRFEIDGHVPYISTLYIACPGGTVIVEDCDVVTEDDIGIGAPALLSVQSCRRLLIRKTQIIAGDLYDVVKNQIPTSGLQVNATEMVCLDSVRIRGSSTFDTDSIWPPHYDGAPAASITAPLVTMTRCTIEDGNGGFAKQDPTAHTHAGVSTFGSSLIASESMWLQGADGDQPRPGPTVALGDPEALIHVESGSIGGTITIDVRAPSSSPSRPAIGFFFGVDTQPFASPFGTIVPRFEFGFPTGRFSRSASIAIQIPNDPRLVGTPVFGQTILEGLEFGAVSWGSIGR